MMPWDELFGYASAPAAAEPLNMRVLRKQGRPLLLVPGEARLAVRCLDLYPAQTSRARMAKAALRHLWRLGIFVKAESYPLLLPRTDPFQNYFGSIVSPGSSLPQFGILAGNPAGGTQRFIILLFDSKAEPRS